jgi:hypothetical protein
MFSVLYIQEGFIFLGAVTAFIGLCVLTSLILKELYRRR